MIERTSIILSDTFLRSSNVQESGNRLLALEITNNIVTVENMLGGYHYESRGKVYNVLLMEDSIVFNDALTGYFTLTYSISYFMGCQDLTYDDKNSMRIDFEINPAEKIINLTGENIREREPDTY